MSRTAYVGLLIALLVLFGCGEQFTRDEAVAVLELSGTSTAEATCMADTLLVLGRLDAADPSYELDDGDREALRTAYGRCESGEELGAEGGRAILEDSDPDLDVDEPGPLEADSAVLGATVLAAPDDIEALAADARARLVGLGRSQEFADCVVERMVAIEAYDVLEDPYLGLGASPVEADVFAGCA